MNPELLFSFNPISLAQLQERSELMERKESKYLMHINQLDQLLTDLKADYDILEINNIREFEYQNVYFDTPELLFYHQHLQQKKSRTKIRTRKYVDSELYFIEYKQKMKSVIKKERVRINPEQYGQLTPITSAFLQECFNKYYELREYFGLQPILTNEYKRITLCNKTKEERITIDTNISYNEIDNSLENPIVLSHLAVIECKYSDSKTAFDDMMKSMSIPKIRLCSKYCLGTYFL